MDSVGAGMSAVAYFVSAHGFGHAARASAVMAALRRRSPDVALHVFTTVPRWFFDDSLRGVFTYHPLRTDVGCTSGRRSDRAAASSRKTADNHRQPSSPWVW